MPVFLVWGPSVTQNSPFLPQHQRQYTLNIPTKGSLDYRGHSKFTSLIVYKDSSRRFALTRTFYDVLIQHRVVHVLDPSTDFIGLDWVWNPFSKMLLLSFKICILVAFNIYIFELFWIKTQYLLLVFVVTLSDCLWLDQWMFYHQLLFNYVAN